MGEASDRQAALASLPHGEGFRFIDALEDLVPGVSGAAIYRLRGDEPALAGHFPDAPEMPGVLMIEALAQLGGIIVQSDPARAPMPGLRLAAVRRAKILGRVLPGDAIRIEARITGRLESLVQVEGFVRCGDREVMRGAVTLTGTE